MRLLTHPAVDGLRDLVREILRWLAKVRVRKDFKQLYRLFTQVREGLNWVITFAVLDDFVQLGTVASDELT